MPAEPLLHVSQYELLLEPAGPLLHDVNSCPVLLFSAGRAWEN